jgi:monoamine oxidase
MEELTAECGATLSNLKVAVVGAGLAGLLAARTLCRAGVKVTVYEARAQVGGRVLSDSTFAKGRITEAGAELIGSIHTRWCALAKEYGISLVSRMNTDLYAGQQLTERRVLDRPLTMPEIRALEHEKTKRVLQPMAELAKREIRDPVRPWLQTAALAKYDRMTVADALTQLQVRRDERLWLAMEMMIVNNNVARLEDMNYLGLLCLVRGGQAGTIADDPLMGYWDELEIYRCADGAQTLALKLAEEINATKGCRVVRQLGVRRIDLDPVGGGVLVMHKSTKNTTFDRWLREKVPENPATAIRRYDYVILTVPPTVWPFIDIVPVHPKGPVGLMGTGDALKFFSNVRERFWIRHGFAPYGGSLTLGQVWEGTDNQTRMKGQDIVLSTFAGGPKHLSDEKDFKRELGALYPDGGKPKPGYAASLRKVMLVDWTKQPFIQTGYASPRLGEVLTIGKRLNEPFQNRMFFAGEHTQLDHFGYMEGALRSGERAAIELITLACRPKGRQVLVA